MEAETSGIPFVPEKGFYQPSSENTWEAYQALITVIEFFLYGRVPRHVLVSASDEVLSVLKSNFNFEFEKKQQIEKLIGSISFDTFEQLVTIGSWITDYNNLGPCNNNNNNNNNNNGDYSRLFYKPSNEENWRSYNLFLDAFKQIIGDQPDMVLRLAADSALLVLKNVDTPVEYRKHVIHTELGANASNWFDHLNSLANLITDYPPLPSDNYIPVATSHGTSFYPEEFYPEEFNFGNPEFENIGIFASDDVSDNVKIEYEQIASDDSDDEEEEKVVGSENDLMASDDTDRGTVEAWMKDLTDDDFQEVNVGIKNLTVQKNGAESSGSEDDECERVIVAGEPYLTAESCSDGEYQKVKVGVRKLTVEENSDEEWLVV